MAGKFRKEKIPDRCDPADPTPVAGYAGTVADLTIDERVRQVVKNMIQGTGDPGPELEPKDLLTLEQLEQSEEMVTPHQMAAMDLENPRTDFDGFLQTLTPDEVGELKEAMAVIEGTKPPDGAGGAEPPEDPPPAPEE